MEQVSITTLTAMQWREYRDLRLRALEESPDAFATTWAQARAYPDEEWAARLQRVSPDVDLPLIARVGDRPAGLLWCRIESPGDAVAHLYQMWVAPECRGGGIGRTLMNRALEWARSAGVRTVVLGVTAGDRPARRLYESAGFLPAGELESLRPGSDLMVQTMQCRLTP